MISKSWSFEEWAMCTMQITFSWNWKYCTSLLMVRDTHHQSELVQYPSPKPAGYPTALMMLEHKRGKLFVEALRVLPVQKMPESFKLYVPPVRHCVPDETDPFLVVALRRAADKV